MIEMKNTRFALEFSKYGTLERLAFDGTVFMMQTDKNGLFEIQLRDIVGNPERFSSQDFSSIKSSVLKEQCEQVLQVVFSDCIAFPGLKVTTSVRLPTNSTETFWHITLDNVPEHYTVEWIDFPRICIVTDMKQNEGKGRFFWPGYEGTLFEELVSRENSPFAPQLLEYPLTGIGGYYPGPCTMQFQSYYTDEAGIYFACHDPKHYPKGIDVFLHNNNAIRPLFQHFMGGETSLAYDVVISGFHGNWQDAAVIYRNWMESNDPTLPVKLKDNQDIPLWLKDSPMLMIYPVKGNGRDSGYMESNEYFPYVQALPVLENYQKLWQTPVMALLMHWEGTAPWAPPYVWPPHGGEEALIDFSQKLHEKGNLLGVYCSGIGWTQTSLINHSYSCIQQFKEEKLQSEMCQGPYGEMYSKVCNGKNSQRIGYDLCPAREFTKNTVVSELKKILMAEVDYLQYFDQNQGASAPLCYAKDHEHPAVPGSWLTDSMSLLLNESAKAVESASRKVVLGCENAAAEPYIANLQLNDLRSQLAWIAGGEAVPAYSMVFHEYINNFTGNGVCVNDTFDKEKSPEYLQFLIAESFSAGNILSAVLKDKGELHWSWGAHWQETPPNQAELRIFFKNLISWRRNRAHDYLVFGRRIKPPISKSDTWTLHFNKDCLNRPEAKINSVLLSYWNYENRNAAIAVNFRSSGQKVIIDFEQEVSGCICCNPEKAEKGEKYFETQLLELDIPALSAVMIEVTNK